MEELIRQKCEEVGITPDILTKSELSQLRKEIESEQNGGVVLDGVLSNPKILYRSLAQ